MCNLLTLRYQNLTVFTTNTTSLCQFHPPSTIIIYCLQSHLIVMLSSASHSSYQPHSKTLLPEEFCGHIYFLFPNLSTCPTQENLRNFSTPAILCDLYKSRSSICNFLSFPLNSFLLEPIFPGALRFQTLVSRVHNHTK